LLGDAEFVFLGDVFCLSVFLAPNAVAGFAGRVPEHREYHVPAAQFNVAPSEDEFGMDRRARWFLPLSFFSQSIKKVVSMQGMRAK
jgi:hypothetical protein